MKCLSVYWLIVSLLLLFGQNWHTVHSEARRQNLNSAFFYMYFQTAILLQDAVYLYTNFSEWNSDPWPRSTFEHTVKVILSHGIELKA